MIKIIVFVADQDIKEIEIKGHSGYAESGSDIVCAAVSALAINTANSIEKLTSCSAKCKMKDGYMSIRIREPYKEDVRLLLDSLVLGLKEICSEYPEYVAIEYKD